MVIGSYREIRRRGLRGFVAKGSSSGIIGGFRGEVGPVHLARGTVGAERGVVGDSGVGNQNKLAYYGGFGNLPAFRDALQSGLLDGVNLDVDNVRGVTVRLAFCLWGCLGFCCGAA